MNKLFEFPFETTLAALHSNVAWAKNVKNRCERKSFFRLQQDTLSSSKSGGVVLWIELTKSTWIFFFFFLCLHLIYSHGIKGSPISYDFVAIPFYIFIKSHSRAISVKLRNRQSWSGGRLEVQLHQQSVLLKWETFSGLHLPSP